MNELNLGVEFALIAINEDGFAAGNSTGATVGTAPILQDTEETNAWLLWEAGWRDVIIVNPDGVRTGMYSLNSPNDLRSEEVDEESGFTPYETLKALVLAALDGAG